MRILVLSCDKYSDAWRPFFHFFRKFWPGCPYPVHLATDLGVQETYDLGVPDDVLMFEAGRVGWNRILTDFTARYNDQPILLLLEDYFLTAPVNTALVADGLLWQRMRKAGCVRLYPCPGGDYGIGHPYWSAISNNAPYRISTQAAIWDPAYLHTIAAMTRSPWKFEIEGTKISRTMSQPLYGFNREFRPWPLEYLCTAIVRGKWQRDALDYCERDGVAVDTSRRPIEPRP